VSGLILLLLEFLGILTVPESKNKRHLSAKLLDIATGRLDGYSDVQKNGTKSGRILNLIVRFG
jgi:hypothetical protein